MTCSDRQVGVSLASTSVPLTERSFVTDDVTGYIPSVNYLLERFLAKPAVPTQRFTQIKATRSDFSSTVVAR